MFILLNSQCSIAAWEREGVPIRELYFNELEMNDK